MRTTSSLPRHAAAGRVLVVLDRATRRGVGVQRHGCCEPHASGRVGGGLVVLRRPGCGAAGRTADAECSDRPIARTARGPGGSARGAHTGRRCGPIGHPASRRRADRDGSALSGTRPGSGTAARGGRCDRHRPTAHTRRDDRRRHDRTGPRTRCHGRRARHRTRGGDRSGARIGRLTATVTVGRVAGRHAARTRSRRAPRRDRGGRRPPSSSR